MEWSVISFWLLFAGLGMSTLGLCADEHIPNINIVAKHSNYAYPDKVTVNRTAEGLKVIGVVKQLRPSRLPIGGYVLVQLLDRDNNLLAENRATLKSASKEVARLKGLAFSVFFPNPPNGIHTVRVRHRTK